MLYDSLKFAWDFKGEYQIHCATRGSGVAQVLKIHESLFLAEPRFAKTFFTRRDDLAPETRV